VVGPFKMVSTEREVQLEEGRRWKAGHEASANNNA
jgi:hypothetical protein